MKSVLLVSYAAAVWGGVCPIDSYVAEENVQIVPLVHSGFLANEPSNIVSSKACVTNGVTVYCAICPFPSNPLQQVSLLNCDFGQNAAANPGFTFEVSRNFTSICDPRSKLCIASSSSDTPIYVERDTLKNGVDGIFELISMPNSIQFLITANGSVTINLKNLWMIKNKKNGLCLSAEDVNKPLKFDTCQTFILSQQMMLFDPFTGAEFNEQ